MAKLSIVIPIYNQKNMIQEVVQEMLAFPLTQGVDRELILVDDGSTELIQGLVQKESKVKLALHGKNRGKGSAIRSGISAATGDFIMIHSANARYDSQKYAALLQPLLAGKADAVYGAPILKSQYRKTDFLSSNFINSLRTTVSNFFTNQNLTDIGSSLIITRTNILKSIPIRSNRVGFEEEITAKLVKRGCRIEEIPISFQQTTAPIDNSRVDLKGLEALKTIVFFWLIDDLYNHEYGHDILHCMSKTHRFNRWMAGVIAPWVGERILEIGAGMGNITQQLLPRAAYVASDIDPLHLNYLKNFFNNNKNIVVEKIDLTNPSDFDKHENRYDTVVCLNVLEHVEDDLQGLASIYRALSPGGMACILVPRGKWLYGSQDVVLGHVRRYEEDELKDKLIQTNFRIIALFTFNRITTPIWFINGRIFQKKHFGRAQLKLFDSSVWLWRRIERFLPWKGLSIIAIAQKPVSS